LGGAAEVLEPAVDRLGRAVGGAGSVEVGENIVGALLQRPAQRDDLDQGFGDTGADGLDELDHQLAAMATMFVSVGLDHPLIDAPGSPRPRHGRRRRTAL
jgi:hypothetical protein